MKKIDLLEKGLSKNVGTKEALEILGVSESTLRRSRGCSEIIWVRAGKKDLNDRMSLYAFKDAYKKGPPATLHLSNPKKHQRQA